MLVLSRRSHESVVIGGSGGIDRVLRITVIDVRDGAVKLGIEADADIPVHRAEVWGKIFPNGPCVPAATFRQAAAAVQHEKTRPDAPVA